MSVTDDSPRHEDAKQDLFRPERTPANPGDLDRLVPRRIVAMR
jgi:hypothetical protein